MREPDALWREDSAVWQLIAGELVLQQDSSSAQSFRLLLEQGQARAADAAGLARRDDLDNAGHAMIGCSVALGLAARADAPSELPAESSAADLATGIAWGARQPASWELDQLAEAIGRLLEADQLDAARGVMDLAVRAGSYAAGFSGHITRRRQRRDLLEPAASTP